MAEPVIDVRAALVAQGGRLAAELRALEASGLCEQVRGELWSWAAWLAIVRGLRGATTVRRYLEVTRRYLLWCQAEGVDYSVAKRGQIETWQQWLFLRRRASPSWRSQQLVAVRQFYRWRAAQGLGADSAAHVRGPSIAVKTPRKYSRYELRKMLACTPGDDLIQIRDRAIVLTLLCTGLRCEELVRMQLSQLQLRPRTGVIRVLGKGAREREVALEGPVIDALRRWLLEREKIPVADPEAVWVIVHGRSHQHGHRMSMQAVEHTVRRVAKRAQLTTWGVHRFRVTFATSLYDAGYDLERIRAVMGHGSIETTRRYISVSEKRRQVRLSARTQRELIGLDTDGLPAWARQMGVTTGGADDV